MQSGGNELVPYLKALILLELELLRQYETDVKPELLLSRAGLGIVEIAEMLDKNYQATAKAISRARVETRRRPTEGGGS